MANYYLNKDGSITKKQKTDKEKNKKSQLEQNKQISEKIKQQRAFRDELTKPIDYSTYDTSSLKTARDKLQNKMLQYDGTKDAKGNYTLKGIIDTFTGASRKKLAKDKTYQTAQEKLDTMNNILKQRFEESKKGQSKEMKMITALEKPVLTANEAAEETRQNPIQSIKTFGVGFGEGVHSAKNAIQSSLLDLENALSMGNLQNNLWYQDQRRQVEMDKLNDIWKDTKTYKNLEEGKLSSGQQAVYSVGTNIGAMGPAIATTALTGSPTAGSAVFYAQAQDNYYNEAKQRGYNEKQARMYGLAMAGVETLVERLGFDEIGGLKEGSIAKAMLGEGAEEFVTPYIDAAFRKYGFKEDIKADDVHKEAIEGAFMGATVGAIMQLGGNGFAKVDKLINKVENNQKIEPTDVQEAFQEVQQADPEFANKIIDETANNLDENTIKEIEQQLKPTEQQEIAPNTTEQVQEAKTQENAPSVEQDATMQEEKPVVEETKEPEIIPSTEKKKEGQYQYNFDNATKVIDNLTEGSTPEQKQQTEQILAEPSKNKTIVKIDDDTSLINPSEKTREGGLEAASDYIKNSVSNREEKQISIENKQRRSSYNKLEEYYKSQNNNEMVEYIEKLKDNDLYTVEHSGYNVFNESLKLLEDPETYYKNYNKELENIDFNNVDNIKKLEYQQVAMLRYFGDINSPGYNPSIAADISAAFAQEGTNIAQAMATRKQMYIDSPQQIAIRTQQTLNSLFKEEAKKHEGDINWLEKNDPVKNPDSPYKMTDSQFAYINHEANLLSKIEDKTSVEYLETYATLHNYIQNLFGNKKLTGKIKRLTLTNVLASTRIWTQNIKGNFVNLAQFNGIDKLWGTGIDKIISKSSDMRTLGMSFEGDVIQGIKAFKQGIGDSFYELKHDISISKFHSKYTDKTAIDVSKLGTKDFGKTFDDNTKVGHLMNRYQDFVNFALDIGDRPFANMYYEQSIYNQRMLNAQIDAENEKTNVIYNVNFNEKNGNYKVRYFNEKGQKVTTIMNESQYNDFSNKAIVEEITEKMCSIAEKEALEKTYQDDNRITRAALKMKGSLNEVFHVGDYGFGDMILKFTRTGSNMAKALYEHSPLEAIQLTKDIVALNRNIKSKTPSVELQHKVASEAGKLLGGVTTMAIIGALDWSGILKIEGKHDKDKEDKFKESTMGSQEYSFTLPGTNYKYKISNDSTIGSLARLGKTAEDLIQETNSALDTLFGMTNPFVNSLIDNSFMSSVLDLGNSYSDPVDNLAKKIAAQPSNLIPSALKDISFAIDNFEERNTYDDNLTQYMINQIINKTPLRGSDLDIDTPIGKIKGLSGKTTAWGDVKTVGGDVLASAWNTFLTGDTLSKVKNDEISNEVVDVYQQTNNTKAIPNLTTTKDFSYNGSKYNLSEKEQNKYMTTYGKKAYESVRKMMNTNQYKNATYDQKVKLLEKAYSNAKEAAMQEYLNNNGLEYYNYKKKDGKYTEYKKNVFNEIIENDISIEDATYKRKYNNSYKLKTSITSLENYQDIAKDIKEIKQAYKNQPYKVQKYAVQSYINELQGLNSVQKAMLSKLEHSKSDYSNYDDKILQYIRSLKLTDEEYQYMYNQLGLGGYWSMYYKTKKKR